MNFLEDIVPTSSVVINPRGYQTAPIAIVGEAPSKDEVKYMQPFMGRHGSLLKKLIMQSQLSMNDIYMTYLIKSPQYDRTFKKFYAKKMFSVEGQLWLNLLKEELMSLECNVILAVGELALNALTDKSSITKWRGSVLPCTLVPGLKVIPTLDPGKALGKFVYRFHITHDLKRLREEAEFPDIRYPERNLIINRDWRYTEAWFDRFDETGITDLCIDIEVTGRLELSCMAFGYDPKEAISVPIPKFSPQEEAKFWLRVAKYFSSEKYTIIGQNIMFDIHFLLVKHSIVPRCRIDDTFTMQGVLFPGFPRGLDFLCSVYTNEPYYKQDGKEWKVVKDWPMFWRYNAKDVATTLEIWQKLKKIAIRDGFWDTYERNNRLHLCLLFMSYIGMKATPERIKQTQDDLEKRIYTLQQEIDTMVKARLQSKGILDLKEVQVDSHSLQRGILNVNSPAQMKKYFYESLKIPAYKNKGKPTCDDKALQRLAKGTSARPGLPEASLIQELIGMKKFRGTYLDIDFDEDKRLRCTYVPGGTIFGRLSSRMTIFHTGMNMQNLPDDFKGFLLADPGYILFELDKVQAEWVASAYIANELEMIRIIEAGLDPHTETTMLLTGLPRDLIIEEAHLLGHLTNPTKISAVRTKFAPIGSANRKAYQLAKFVPRTMSCRQCGKKSNHGYNYGLMAPAFALQNEVPEEDAQHSYDGYHDAYIGLHAWHDRVKLKLQKEKMLTNCFGRQVRLIGRWDTHLWNQAYSFEPQSTVVDLINEAMYETYMQSAPGRDIYLRPVELLAQVHDSLVFQYPIREGIYNMSKAIMRIKELMEPTLMGSQKEYILATDAKMGYSWGKKEMVDLDITSYDNVFKGINNFIDKRRK